MFSKTIKAFLASIVLFFATAGNSAFTPPVAAFDDAQTHEFLATWIIENANKNVSKETATKYVKEAYFAADKYAIDPLLILAIIRAESNFREKVTNGYGAKGLMQVVSRYHRDKINGRNILDYRTNIDVGARILDEYLRSSNENFERALRKYSGGAGKTYRNKLSNTYQELRVSMLEWKMDNNYPIVATYVYDKPRTYSKSVTYHAQLVNDRSQQVAMYSPRIFGE